MLKPDQIKHFQDKNEKFYFDYLRRDKDNSWSEENINNLKNDQKHQQDSCD